MKKKADKECRLQFINGNFANITLPEPSTELQPSCFAFSLHKAGSSLLNAMLHDYSQKVEVALVDLPILAVNSGAGDATKITKESFQNIFRPNGYLYCGWRMYTTCLDGVDFSLTRNIVLVRDPRDRLVSQYFSFGRSHRPPKKGASSEMFLASREDAVSKTIDEYAISKITWIDHNWNLYHKRLSPATTRVYRYEDIIFRKEEWLGDIVSFFALPYDEKAIKNIAVANDIRPDEENPNAHIRQVTPGNFAKHLAPETIERLNGDLKNYLDAYDYLKPEKFGEKLIFAREGSETSSIFESFLLS